MRVGTPGQEVCKAVFICMSDVMELLNSDRKEEKWKTNQ